MKTYPYTDEWGNKMLLHFRIEDYSLGYGDLIPCIMAYTVVDGEIDEPYACATVNLPYPLSFKHATYLDYNNSKHLCQFLESQGLIIRTGIEMPSGYCMYPEAVVLVEAF